jgi:hypothetical protein
MATGVCAALTSACSWSRFGDLTEDTPVVLLKKPGKLSSFGVSLSAVTLDKKSTLLVGGAAGFSAAAVYSLDNPDKPGLDANDAGYCENSDEHPCYLGTSSAGLATARSPDGVLRNSCFLLGIGSTKGSGSGIVARCEDHYEFALDVPAIARTSLIDPVLGSKDPKPVALTADRQKGASVVGASSSQLAWAYGPTSLVPVELVPAGTPDKSYGDRVAVLRVADGFVFAVAAPAQGHVWLFRSKDASSTDASVSAANLVAIGCLGGISGFGRALAAGRVDRDEQDELVIADTANVSVFDGAVLAGLAASSSADCSIQSLPRGALQVSFTCGSTGDIGGCAASDFGAALAVGDLDGDGDGEVVVGAPRMTAREASQGGAVLVYDVEGPKNYALTEAQFISSAEDEDQLGAALATPWIGNRHIIAAGAPGGGKTALFYCSRLLPDSKRGPHCR